MNENLDESCFANGDAIPQAHNAKELKYACENKQPVWCYYNFCFFYGYKYGKLYNYYAVKDKRGLAPNGYHIPTNKEFLDLVNFLGGEGYAGKHLKYTSGWDSVNNRDGNGNNSSYFSALPGGSASDPTCDGAGQEGIWWSLPSNDEDVITAFGIFSDENNIYSLDQHDICFMYTGDITAYSVRCIKD